MWRDINRIYEKHDLVLPILGDGITRFDDGQNDPSNLLRCMLCTLNTSKVQFKSKVTIVVYDGREEENKGQSEVKEEVAEEKKVELKNKGHKPVKLPLYEYKDLFRIVR